MKKLLLSSLAAVCLVGTGSAATVTVGPSTDPWLGYMNVFELPANGGGFVFGSGWGTGDLVSTFDDGAGTITLSPNTIGDPDPFWYQGGGAPGSPGNKVMEASLYIEVNDDSLAGQTVEFQFDLLANSFTEAHDAVAFIRDYVPDYSSFTESTVTLDTLGLNTVSLMTDPASGRHVQYGFRVTGENVWITDTELFGFTQVGAPIPEPGTFALLFGAIALFVANRRRQA